MFALLTSQSGLPTVISRNDHNYPHLLMQGYTVIDKGKRKAMLDKERELLEELYQTNDFLIN